MNEPESYFCEKHQRNHKKGSKVYDDCFSGYIDKATPPAPTVPEREPHPDLATNPPSGAATGGSGKEGVVADKKWDDASEKASEYGKDFQIPVKMTKETYDRLMHEKMPLKVANYRAERWEWADGHHAFFSPSELLQFAKRITIAQGKKWHWWNEKKRLKECKKMGIDPVNREGQGDV